MSFQLILPVAPLRHVVRFFWALDTEAAGEKERTFKIIADGLPGLVFQRDRTAFRDRDQQQLPQLFLYGQNTHYYGTLRVKGSFYNLGASLQPVALKILFGLDAHELTNKLVDLEVLTCRRIAERLSEAPGAREQVSMLESFFLERIRSAAGADKMQLATEKIRKGLPLKAVQNELGLSERSLQRGFKQYIGISPRLYARICRFQSALQAIRRSDFSSLTELAYRQDYFDQAHFIRDFHTFAGASPRQFLTQAREQLPNFPEWLD